MYKSSLGAAFRNHFAESIFVQKYRHEGALTWEELARTLVDDVCRERMSDDDKDTLTQYIIEMKFIPGGRYCYYAGRKRKFFNNCFLFRSEQDSREDWANLSWKAESCLTTGGGIGNDYSVYRPRGTPLHGTGGSASGSVSKAAMVNEIGRHVMQGGSRRSAIYASLNWQHGDIQEFMIAKNWQDHKIPGTEVTYKQAKEADFNFHCPLDMTNISVNYDTEWLLNFWKTGEVGKIFLNNVRQALSTGEPGFSFNFFNKERETLRNACTEVTSEDDSDLCNLGSLNFANISSVEELADVTDLATRFLICGTLVSDVPYPKIAEVREQNRRIGLGLMGLAEWLVQRGLKYEVTPELHRWLYIYKKVSNDVANKCADKLSISRPIARRAIAPTGTIGILAGTSTGIEPIFSVAYKRRFLKGTKWHYQYVVDGAAQTLKETYSVDPDTIDSALVMAADPERRVKFQADVQDYVDMSISSTINLPIWGSDLNNEDKVDGFAKILASYSHRIRGFTCYPDGSRGGQPLAPVPYRDAVEKLGETFEENIAVHDICDISGRGGVCGA